MFELDQKIFEEWLGSPVNIKGVRDCKTLDETGAFAFELYKEAIRLVVFTAHLLDEAAANQGGFSRNQAICAGLMVKISKFMISVAQLSASEERGEVILALNRIILEAAINLEFLVRSTEDKYFDQFVEFSLGPEREMCDQIKANIEARKGEVWPIEKRLLDSTDYICAASGMKIEEVERKHRDWGTNARERLKTLGKEYMYATGYRMQSHAVHGSWVDLFTAHLDYDDTTKLFRPETKWTRAGTRLLAPMAMLVLEALDPYLEKFFPATGETSLLRERIADLHERLREADHADEELKVKLRAA